MSNEQEGHAEEVTVPIRIEGAEDTPILYTNYISVTHTNDEFFLTFAQLHPPYLIPTTKEDIGKLKPISARVVSRVALTPNKFKELLDVLQVNYQKYTKRKRPS